METPNPHQDPTAKAMSDIKNMMEARKALGKDFESLSFYYRPENLEEKLLKLQNANVAERLARLLSAGLPALRVFQIIESQEGKSLHKSVMGVAADLIESGVPAGSALMQAQEKLRKAGIMRNCDRLFDPCYCAALDADDSIRDPFLGKWADIMRGLAAPGAKPDFHFMSLELCEWCAKIGLLISSGFPILDTLALAAESSPEELKHATMKVFCAIREGESMAGPMAADPIFPDELRKMIDVGEETGDLDYVLIKLAGAR